MRPKVQVVFDCGDPERLSNFYAAALHYILQPPPSGFATWEEALTAWNVPEEEWDSASAIIDPEGIGPRIYFQKMDTPKTTKNRVHLDVNASSGTAISLDERKKQVNSTVEELIKIGARNKTFGKMNESTG